mmetsp:Transcript_21775/g.53997  ORF Transcript_21775/g.53997 Transcript_21775/m.53997 type:complete len:203 (+) Transcript_21775:78-686(+)
MNSLVGIPFSIRVPLRKITLLALLFATIVGRSQSLLQVHPHQTSRLVGASTLPHISCGQTLLGMASTGYDLKKSSDRMEGPPHVETVLFVECGFGNDSHGQSATKAAVRACRNAIEFNSIPSVARLVPNGYDGLKLDVLVAVPAKYKESLDLSKVEEVFPYGSIRFQIQDGGMVAPSGIAIDSLGDKNDDMVVVCVAVSVGY